MMAYCLTQCSNGSSLGSFLFLRQHNQGKRPMMAYCFTQCSNGSSLGNRLLRNSGRILWQGHYPCAKFMNVKEVTSYIPSNRLLWVVSCMISRFPDHDLPPLYREVVWPFNGARACYKILSVHSQSKHVWKCLSTTSVPVGISPNTTSDPSYHDYARSSCYSRSFSKQHTSIGLQWSG